MTMSWEDRLQKGGIGERIVRGWLEDMNYIVYEPVTVGVPHPFDKMCATLDKKTIFIAEVKTKASRDKYSDIGVNERNIQEYLYISKKHNLSVRLFFVDPRRREVYGNLLSVLNERYVDVVNNREVTYPLLLNEVRYFPLKKMKFCKHLSHAEVAEIINVGKQGELDDATTS